MSTEVDEMRFKRIFACTVVMLSWAVGFLTASPIHAQPEPFYKGKQIRTIVGASAGGFYDRWARLLARSLPKYIPGNPAMIVQTMPGGGSLWRPITFRRSRSPMALRC
jgi:tripartite-type tricarboxylate transporter receptor subunit TctC